MSFSGAKSCKFFFLEFFFLVLGDCRLVQSFIKGARYFPVTKNLRTPRGTPETVKITVRDDHEKLALCYKMLFK